MMINFEILGRVAAREEGQRLALPPQQQLLLARLVCARGGPVSRRELEHAVWGNGYAPANELKRAMYQLRSSLRQALAAQDIVVHEGDAYRLLLDGQQVDAFRFTDRLNEAANSAGAVRDRLEQEALDEWGPQASGLFGGRPLLGLDGGWAHGMRRKLRAQYRDAVIDSLQRDAEAEDWRSLLRKCRRLAAEDQEDPHRKDPQEAMADPGFLQLWMLAAHRCGQPDTVEQLLRQGTEIAARFGRPVSDDLARWGQLLRDGAPAGAFPDVAAAAPAHSSSSTSNETAGQPTDDSADGDNLLFRVYIPKTQLYAEQRREMLRLFKTWLIFVQGLDIREQDFSTKNGDTVAFYTGPAQSRPVLGEEYREFVSFVERSAHNPSTAIDHLIEIGIDESTGTEIVTEYTKKYRRMELDLHHARQNRILSLQQTLEGQLLDKGASPEDIVAIQSFQIRPLLHQVVPLPSTVLSLPAIAAPGLSHPPRQANMTFNAEQINYTVYNDLSGTMNFGPEAKQLLALIDQHAGTQAATMLTALHDVEDPGIPAKERATAKEKLISFLVDLSKRVPDIGVDLLKAYLMRKLGFPD